MKNPNPEDLEHQLLMKSHQQRLWEYIAVICPNHSSVDDILQETNRVIWEKRSDFQPGTNFQAWARKIAQYQTMSFQKKFKSSSWLCFDSELVQTLAKATEDRDDMQEKRAKALADCIACLPEADKTLIKMKYDLPLSLQEISKKTSRSEGALKQVFLRIRKALRECVERKIMLDIG